MDEKLLEAGIKTDELNHNHMGALKKQICQLIDRQSMAELEKTFDNLAKHAGEVFADIKSHRYTFGTGLDVAKRSLTDFQRQYETLLAKGKDKEATDLLGGTLTIPPNDILAMTQQANTGQKSPEYAATPGKEQAEAVAALKRANVGSTENEIKAYRQLVEALNDQVGMESRIAEAQHRRRATPHRRPDRRWTMRPGRP